MIMKATATGELSGHVLKAFDTATLTDLAVTLGVGF